MFTKLFSCGPNTPRASRTLNCFRESKAIISPCQQLDWNSLASCSRVKDWNLPFNIGKTSHSFSHAFSTSLQTKWREKIRIHLYSKRRNLSNFREVFFFCKISSAWRNIRLWLRQNQRWRWLRQLLCGSITQRWWGLKGSWRITIEITRSEVSNK